MFFKEIFMDETGSLSYLVGCTEEKTACVINPKRDAHDYLDAAFEHGVAITHIFDSRQGSGNRTGNMELKLRTGADIYYLNTIEQTTHHQAIAGDQFEFGSVRLSVVDCPSHDPAGTSILVTDASDIRAPWLVLGSDSLFIGDIASPDTGGERLRKAVSRYLDNGAFSLARSRSPETLYTNFCQSGAREYAASLA